MGVPSPSGRVTQSSSDVAPPHGRALPAWGHVVLPHGGGSAGGTVVFSFCGSLHSPALPSLAPLLTGAQRLKSGRSLDPRSAACCRFGVRLHAPAAAACVRPLRKGSLTFWGGQLISVSVGHATFLPSNYFLSLLGRLMKSFQSIIKTDFCLKPRPRGRQVLAPARHLGSRAHVGSRAPGCSSPPRALPGCPVEGMSGHRGQAGGCA